MRQTVQYQIPVTYELAAAIEKAAKDSGIPAELLIVAVLNERFQNELASDLATNQGYLGALALKLNLAPATIIKHLRGEVAVDTLSGFHD